MDADDHLLVDALGGRAVPAIWDDPDVDWDAFELVVLRNTWDYVGRHGQYLAWAERVGGRLLNPLEVVRWNIDKRYLIELAGAGLPVVSTQVAGEDGELPAPPLVVKPAVGAGTVEALRHNELASATEHAARLRASGAVPLAQPYLDGVEAAGETALMFFDGVYSHAIRKGPLLHPEAERDGSGLFVSEDITPREPSEAERAAAGRIMAWVAERFGTLAYARVDLLPHASDGPALLELELTEPSLFFVHAEDAAERFAAAILSRL